MASKGRFRGPDKVEDHHALTKEKERRKRKSEEESNLVGFLKTFPPNGPFVSNIFLSPK